MNRRLLPSVSNLISLPAISYRLLSICLFRKKGKARALGGLLALLRLLGGLVYKHGHDVSFVHDK